MQETREKSQTKDCILSKDQSKYIWERIDVDFHDSHVLDSKLQEKLESLGTKPSTQTLSLLRQLKYIESVMLQGKNVYIDELESRDRPNALDVEMILLDLL